MFIDSQCGSTTEEVNYGLIAKDIEKLPGTNYSIVTIGGDKDRMLGLRYTDFIAPMVNAMQEQESKIEAQQKETAELKQLIKSLSLINK